MKTPTIKQLDHLWAEVIKARAGYKSEYKKTKGILNAHHIDGKGNYRMRWELKNGVCITNGQHFFVAHKASMASTFRTWAMKLRGVTEDEITLWKQSIGKCDKWAVYLYLKKELKKYKT